MNMPDRPETWAWVSTLLQQFWPSIYAGLLAAAIGGLRIMYGGGKVKQALFEAALCGCITLSVSQGLHLIGLSLESAPFFGGVIGLLGVEFVRARAKRFFKIKTDGAPQP